MTIAAHFHDPMPNAQSLRKPYLIFLGDITTPSDAKTGAGLRDWCGADVLGECRLPAGTVSLGLPVLTPAGAAARDR